MFTTPIKYVPLTSVEEIKNFSHRVGSNNKVTPLTKCQNNGQIAYADEYGCVYVTPYRPKINDILEDAGYSDGTIFVPFSNGETRPAEYLWLAKIADEESWAYTYEKAFAISKEKGIKPVDIVGKYLIKEISYFDDESTNTIYTALCTKFLFNYSKDNIGTYIFVDEKTLVICDEYGRTFLLKAKTVVNSIVNALIEAGYTRTLHPEWYIQKYELKTEEE